MTLKLIITETNYHIVLDTGESTWTFIAEGKTKAEAWYNARNRLRNLAQQADTERKKLA